MAAKLKLWETKACHSSSSKLPTCNKTFYEILFLTKILSRNHFSIFGLGDLDLDPTMMLKNVVIIINPYFFFLNSKAMSLKKRKLNTCTYIWSGHYWVRLLHHSIGNAHGFSNKGHCQVTAIRIYTWPFPLNQIYKVNIILK